MFEELLKINVNDKIEKKKNGNVELSYLSWSYAVEEFTKKCPNFTYEIKKFENGLPYVYDENTGYMVFTSITVDNLTKEMWLPVMDGANKAMKKERYTYETKYGQKTVEPATMFDINKTIMRCLVKNMAMFGLGLYIYNGEDLPEGESVDLVKETLNTFKGSFVKPNREDVDNYIFSNNLEYVNGDTMWQYFENNNWLDKKSGEPINWKKFINWCNERNKNNKK